MATMRKAKAGRPTRVSVVVSHPIQYFSPLFDRLAEDPTIDLTVLYGCDDGLIPAADAGFGRVVQWDIDLVSGHRTLVLARKGTARQRRERRRWWWALLTAEVVVVHGYVEPVSAAAIAVRMLTGRPYLLRSDSTSRTGHRRWDPREMWVTTVSARATGALSSGTLNERVQRDNGIRLTYPVPFAVDVNRFRRAASRDRESSTLRAELGLAPETEVVVFSGKLVQNKNPAHICDAVQRLRESGRDVELLVIGDGALRAQLERDYSGKGVVCTGFVNQSLMPDYLALGHVLVLASEREAWGLVANEALACGLVPVLADSVGALPDLELYGAVRFPVGDVDALVSAVSKALDSYGSSQQTAQVSAYLADYSIEAAAQAMAQALTAAASR